jgi:hypothetical protein
MAGRADEACASAGAPSVVASERRLWVGLRAFADTPANGEVAPIPAICGGIIEPLEAIDPMAAIACSAEYGS